MEIWKDIEGYEGYYQVSDHGRIWSNIRKIYMKHQFDRDGYHQVCLKRKTHKVHRLVLINFVGKSKLLGLHRNGDKDNNNLTNLYWGTNSQNTLDQVSHGTHKESSKTHCPRGHLLEFPNLIERELLEKGKRICLACSRARNTTCTKENFQEVSDYFYNEACEPLYNKYKTHCKNNHKLIEPNLTKAQLKIGKRNCLSCGRARAYLRSKDSFTQELFKELSDDYYKKLGMI